MILVVSVLLCIVIALFIFFGSKNNFSNLFFVVFLSSIILYFLAHISWVILQDLQLSVIFVNHFTPVYFLTGPALYFYVKSILNGRYIFKKKDLLHCLPFFLQLIAITDYLFFSTEEKITLLQTLLDDPKSALELKFNLFFNPTTNFALRLSSVAIYILLSYSHIYKTRALFKHYRITYQWLLSILTFFSSLVFFYSLMITNYFNDPEQLFVIVNSTLAIIALSCLFVISLLPLFYPHVLYGADNIFIQKTSVNEKRKIETLPDTQMISLSKKIITFFEEEQPYLERKFTLPYLAEKMNVPVYLIQKCFRELHKTTFVEFKTKYKIEWIKKALFDPAFKNDTIDAIGMCAGFNSKSQFYIAFKKHTGYTPKKYHTKYLPKKK